MYNQLNFLKNITITVITKEVIFFLYFNFKELVFKKKKNDVTIMFKEASIVNRNVYTDNV